MKKIIILSILMMLIIPLLATTAAANNPPVNPTIEGPTTGESGVEYTYHFRSIDPDGDNINYRIRWGDESNEEYIGPFASGASLLRGHTFEEDGTYTIMVKAQDMYGAESDWTTLEVSMPKDTVRLPFFQMIMEKIFYKFSFLRILMN